VRFCCREEFGSVMIRFNRIFDLDNEADAYRFSEAAELFRAAFPHEPEAIDRIAEQLRKRIGRTFEPILLISQDHRLHVTGLAFVYYFPELRYGYLQYIASDPQRSSRGIGAALYEALRELLVGRGARGLFLDIPPVNPARIDDKKLLSVNRKRRSFYARYDVHEVKGTLWEIDANPRNDGYLTTLLFDPLGRRPRVERSSARQVIRRILVEQYGYAPHDGFVERIVRSFQSDPVSLAPLDGDHSAAAPTTSKYIRPIKVVVAERHTIHHLRAKGYVERPVRVSAILRGLEKLPTERVPTRRFPESHLMAVHHSQLVEFLKAMGHKLDPKALIYPEIFPIRRPDRMPRALEDRAGYFCCDTFTPVTKNCYPAARDGVNVVMTAASLILSGERMAYALCRPPGHHAERRIYGGFCYFNNSAVAANFLSKHGRVALLDIDYHHGNGAQDIFYSRADVLTVSIHGHPRHAYPNFAGYADERGEGEGKGFNRNFPLEAPIDDVAYLKVLEQAIKVIERFAPRFLVVSLGFDIMRGDPTGAFNVTTQGMRRIGNRLGSLGLPVLVVQEGGYALRNLRIGSHAFFLGLGSAWYGR
jgi:acetoin utilization deacetylase AcuC-like enzyme/GNAT superfamily N-acetyltransferase